MLINKNLRKYLLASVSAGAMISSQSAHANPDGATVVTGDVSINGIGTDHVIVENDSLRSVVDWNSFSIGTGETTTINQITNDAAILNRVTGGDITEIYGTLESNGQVFLINRSGIMIGETGIVDTNGFVASTLDLPNADFLGAGDMLFSQGVEAGGGITVHGKIRSVTGGDIFLLSREIEIGETGEISSNGGYVGLGAGEEILLKPTDTGDGRISIRAGKGKIVNRGQIEGAAAELRAAGGNAYALAINNTGVVRATGVSKKGGRIMLTGGGKVRNSGRIVARKKVVVRSTKKITNSGTVKAGDGNKGGEIVFEAPEIQVQTGSLLDVSGALGGGRMFIGGGFQGSGKSRSGDLVDITQNAQLVTVETGAVLNASATESGDGGEIIAWADDTTTFAGDIVATSVDGKGGFAEVSGKDTLSFLGTADLRSESGQFGTLLLDPGGLTVSTAASGANNLNDTDVETALGFANVIITTVGASTGLDTDNADADNNNATGQDVTASDAGTGDVDFLAGVDIQWTADTLLTVHAERDINALDDVIIQHSGVGTVTGTDGVQFLAANNINIGDAGVAGTLGVARTGGVAIGSEHGQTTIMAGDSDFNGSVDLATGDLSVIGGDATGTYAHIGFIQDGAAAASANGNITAEAGNAVNLTGGTGGADTFALIGHGGDQAVAAMAGITNSTITVTAGAGGVNLLASYTAAAAANNNGPDAGGVQIGHGAMSNRGSDSSMGSISGNINVSTRAGTGGTIDINAGALNGAIDANDQMAAARIGHGSYFNALTTAAPSGYTQGAISGTIDVTADGALTLGHDVTHAAGEGNSVIVSQIGHGAVGVGNISAGPTPSGTSNYTFGNIRGTTGDATDVTVRAASVLVQANTTSTDNSGALADEDLVNNVQRSQIGHGSFLLTNESDTAAPGTAPLDVVVTEGRISGDVEVYDTNGTDSRGITLTSSVTEGDAPATLHDMNIARIGHATSNIIGTVDGGTGAASDAFRGGNATVYQAHILDAHVTVDTATRGDGAGGAAGDSFEANNQDITVSTNVAAGTGSVQDNTVVAQIGHGGDVVARTGDGADAVQNVDGDAADGGDITIYKGTVWDGGLVRDNDADDLDSLHSMDTTDITVLSSNEVIVTSTSAAANVSAERNSSESQIGHGHRIRVVTGNGGDGGNTGRDGGAGGDILIVQALDAREYGIDQANGLGEYDDYAYGLRGDITVTARETDGVDGTNAISMTSSDTSASAAARNNSDYSVVGHSDVIELVSGNGGAGGGLGAGGGTDAGGTDGTDDTGDTNTADPFGQITAHGGRGGHIDVQLGRLRVDQDELVDASDEDWHERGDLENRFFADTIYANRNNTQDFTTPYNTADLGDNRDGAVFLHSNAQADARLQGVMLTEGDITINAIGRVVLDSSANNATSASDRSITESVIGHGQRAFADSGNGGNGGSANFNSNSDAQLRQTVFQSEIAGEQFLNYESGVGSNRGGNGGDIRLTQGDITDRQIANRIAGDHNEIYHDTDADHQVSADIFLNIRDTFTIDINGATVAPTAVSGGANLPDSLVLTSAVNIGQGEGTGNEVLAGVGHHVRLFAEGGTGGGGGSTNTEFDNDGNSLFADGTGQTDTQGTPTNNDDDVDETALQAGAVHIQPNSSGGRGGDALVINDNINGNIVVNADRRVTIATTAGHGTETLVVSGIGHNTYVFAATQNGGTGGDLYEPATTGATFDGGIINVNGTQTGANAGASTFAHVLIDGNQDDKFNLVSNGDSTSTEGEDGIAVTPDDIANRVGSTVQSVYDSHGTLADTNTDNIDGRDIYAAATGGTGNAVIFHDEEADPEFILDGNGNFVLNNLQNNTDYAAHADNLARFGRVVATYDGTQDQNSGGGGDNFRIVNYHSTGLAQLGGGTRATDLGDGAANRQFLEVFVDMDGDGDVDLVDFDRDGRLDIVDVDNDGFMDVIDGRANYVDSRLTTNVLVGSGIPNGITGLGVLDYVAVTGVGYTGDQDQNWSIKRQLTSVDLLDQYHLGSGTRNTSLVGDFSIANGGRGGDAYTHTGYSIGDISVSTGNNDLGEATSLAVTVNLTDDSNSNAGFDTHVANIGHNAFQWSDANAAHAADRAGREGLQGTFDPHVAANGGNAGYYAVNGDGGRGGDALARQGERRDVNPSEVARAFENDHLIGNIWVNTPNALDNSFSNDAKQILVDSFVDTDYGDNLAIASLGHRAGASVHGGNGGNGGSDPGGENGSSQTEIANGGRGGYVSILQDQVKGFIEVMTGADDADGSNDFSFVMRAENGAATSPGGPRNTIISQVGHGRVAGAVAGNGGDGDDGQLKGNGGDGGDAVVVQQAILDTYVNIDLVSFSTTGGTSDPNGYFGNGMQITANLFENSDNVVRAQVGHGDLAYAESGSGGDGSPDWNVNEQRNQTANGGDGGDARINQTGYAYDITLDIGSNETGGNAFELISSSANVNVGANNFVLASVGHGGMAETVTGAGGDGGLSGAVNGIQTAADPNYVDSDYNYTGAQTNGDTPYDIDEDGNRLVLGTDRRGGHGGNAHVVINDAGTGRIISGRETSNDYGRNDINGADIVVQTRDQFDAGAMASQPGYDGILVRSIAGPGSNQDHALYANTALIGHHGFAHADATGATGGQGIQRGLSAAISEGDGGDGGSAITQIGQIWGDVTVTNVGNPAPAGNLDEVGSDRATNVVIEAIGGTVSDSGDHRAEARAGHLTHASAFAGNGGDSGREAGAPPAFPATISVQGGDGGDALTYQGQLAGDITITSENSIIVQAKDGVLAANMTVAAVGHRTEGRALAGDGAFGGTHIIDGPGTPAQVNVTFQVGTTTYELKRDPGTGDVYFCDGANCFTTYTEDDPNTPANEEAVTGPIADTGFVNVTRPSTAASIYFTYEALREFHARGSNATAYTQMSDLEKKLIDPVLDYFENKPGELEVFLDKMIGDDPDVIAANRRDDDAIGGTNYSIAPLVSGSGHMGGDSGADDGEIETLSAILAASGHGGNAAVVQGSVGLDGVHTDELAASGNTSLTAFAYDTSDADRGITVLGHSDALGDTTQIAHIGHQAEAYKVRGGIGWNVNGRNAGANGIGGDGGDAIVDQYALNGAIDFDSRYKLTVAARDTSLAADETRAWVGHRLAIGPDNDGYRDDPVVEAGVGGSEQSVPYADGHNGNGGDVFIWQRGVISGTARATTGAASTYDTEIQLSALEDVGTVPFVGGTVIVSITDGSGNTIDFELHEDASGDLFLCDGGDCYPYADSSFDANGEPIPGQRVGLAGKTAVAQEAPSGETLGITIEAIATGLSAPDVETHIGHDFLIHSAKAGDAGRQASLSGPNGAAEGLLEGNGGDIFIYQSDLGADIDIVSRDQLLVQGISTLGDHDHLMIGHERTVGLGVDHDNNRSDSTASIVAGLGGDAVPEDINDTARASIDAASDGIIEDGDSGRIEIVLGKIGDSWEDADNNNVDDDERLITMTSIQESVFILAKSSLGSTSILEFGNRQHVHAETGSASEFLGTSYTQPAGDAGGVYVARDDVYGDILIQAIDADRANSETPTEGKVVDIHTQTGLGALAEVKIGHETWFDILTSNPDTVRAAWGRDRTFLFDVATSNLGLFTAPATLDPDTVPNTTTGQATFSDAQNALEDMDNVVRMLEYAVAQYGDRFPADDGEDMDGANPDRDDLGDLIRQRDAAIAARDAARTALNGVDASDLEDTNGGGDADSVESVVSIVQDRALDVVNAAKEFETILTEMNAAMDSGVPNATNLLADPAKAGDIVYGDMTAQVHNIASLRTFEPVADRNVWGLDDHDTTVLQPLDDIGTAPFDLNLLAQGGDVSDTGVVRGDITAFSGRDADLTGIDLRNRGNVIGNDTIVATNFGGTGFTAADDIDDGVVKITTLTNTGETLTELGHRRFMSNVTSFGGGESNGGSDDGGIMGDGGSITTKNTTGGDVTVRAEEVVIHAAGGTGTGEVHLLHSALTMNYATGYSDIEDLMGSGGDISNNTLVYGGLDLDAERIATAIDAQDRTLQAAGAANTFIQFGHQVADDNLSNSDPTIGGNGDSQDNLGANRGGSIDSTQRVYGQQIVNGTTTYGDVVNIGLDVNGDGVVSDLIVETIGTGHSDIRLGHGEDEGTLAASVFHRGVSGGQPAAPRTGGFANPDAPLVASGGVNITDDGDTVTLTQDIDGDIRISQVEDLEIKALGSGDNDIWIGHDAEQFGQSGEVNSGNPQYGERVTVSQAVRGEIDIALSGSFYGEVGASAGEWHMGHEATQTAFSADDSADPSDFEDDDANGVADGNGNSQSGVNDRFDPLDLTMPVSGTNPRQADVVADQLIEAKIGITAIEIILEAGSGKDLQVGHEAFHIAAVDGDKLDTDTSDDANGESTGHVVAVSRINPGDGDNSNDSTDQNDIVFVATGAPGTQQDTIVDHAALNRDDGDIELLGSAANRLQVGHRSTSTMTDGSPVAEGQYNTRQVIGNDTDADGDGLVDDTSEAVISFTAAQDIIIDGAEAQVGHYITEDGISATSQAYTDGNGATGLAGGDSQLRQVVGSDILIGDNTNQGSGGTGTGGAGNNFLLFDGRVGHFSPDNNGSQVEGGIRSVTVQLLDGDITVEAGTDADSDAPDGATLTTAAAGSTDETGTGDDIYISGGAIGHHHAAGGAAPGANETQVAAGDVWVRAGGDLHAVMSARIGHDNYDFATIAVGPTNATVEGQTAGIRNRVRGNTSVGAGQNSAPEDSTLISDIMVFNTADVNSGYGGQGDADVDGELRFFLPAQEGLTIAAPVRFNDSASNGDPTFTRSGSETNIFEGQTGEDHEHDFTFMSETAPYTDQFIGAGNFTFYFESSAEAFPEYTPYINEDDFESGYTIVYRRRGGSQRGEGIVNIGRLGGSQYLGTGSHELACEEQVTPPQGIDADLDDFEQESECEEVRIHFVGQQPGFGSNTGFSGTAGGNQGFARNFDFDQTHVEANGGNSGSSSSNVVFGTELGANPVIEISYPVFSFSTTTVEIDERELARKPVKKSDLVISQVSTYSGSIIHYDVGNTYGEYVEGAEVARSQVEQQYPGALSYASTFTVYQEKQL